MTYLEVCRIPLATLAVRHLNFGLLLGVRQRVLVNWLEKLDFGVFLINVEDSDLLLETPSDACLLFELFGVGRRLRQSLREGVHHLSHRCFLLLKYFLSRPRGVHRGRLDSDLSTLAWLCRT